MKRQRLDVGGLRLEWERRGHMDIGVQVNLCSKIRADALEVKIRQAVNRLSGYCRLERENLLRDGPLSRSFRDRGCRKGQKKKGNKLVRKEGFEPPRPFGHKILSLARLPVPPLPHRRNALIIQVFPPSASVHQLVQPRMPGRC